MAVNTLAIKPIVKRNGKAANRPCPKKEQKEGRDRPS